MLATTPGLPYRAETPLLGNAIRWGIAGLAGLALQGCDTLGTIANSPRPQSRPANAAPPPPEFTRGTKQPSAESEQLAYYYQRVQENLLAQELMRVDGGGVDTPYTTAALARNFERIAFYSEYSQGSEYQNALGQPFGLQKWDQPIRIKLEFGSTVPPEARDSDTNKTRAFVQRLSRITGHPMTVSNRNPNFYVLTMGLDDRDHILRRAQEISPMLNPRSLSQILDKGKSVSCVVYTFASGEGDFTPELGFVIIRSELPAQMREACIHEEIAQGLGLANDSPDARPSIFNDDEEFARLTTHDEELLRLLYNPALTPGMSVDEARPIINRILAARSGPS